MALYCLLCVRMVQPATGVRESSGLLEVLRVCKINERLDFPKEFTPVEVEAPACCRHFCHDGVAKQGSEQAISLFSDKQ
ncbi:hypothetical protein Mapa_002704 [Marchantia paleacea]|nr:hypothetical protein Mapa_002704 [Marchantia paleacea]